MCFHFLFSVNKTLKLYISSVFRRYLINIQLCIVIYRSHRLTWHCVSGSIVQTIFGHYDVVTCIARSECNVSQDCYVVTGSKDCTVMVWHWSTKQQRILGDNGSKFKFHSWRTFPGLHHDVQLTGDLFGVNRPLYVSQHDQLSHSSSWCRQMSTKLNSGIRCAYTRGGAAWRMLTGKGRYGVTCM